MAITLTDKLKKEYERMWASCEIDYQPEVAKQNALKLLKNKARYQGVERATGVPWFWIAVTHNRESSGNFAGVLHNGEKILGTGRKTRLVPAGRGPFDTWEEAAIDALTLKGLNKITDWNVGRFWYEVERFNGFGYRNKGVPSPYLWSHTNHYKDFSGDTDPGGGKYVADHVYDPNVHDTQFGCAAILLAMMVLDKTIRLGQPVVKKKEDTAPRDTPQPAPQLPQAPTPSTTPPLPRPSDGGTAGGLVVVGASIAAWLSSNWVVLVAGLVLAVGAYLGYRLWRKRQSKAVPAKRDPKGSGGKSKPTKEPVPQETPSSPAGPDPVKDEQSPIASEQKPTPE